MEISEKIIYSFNRIFLLQKSPTTHVKQLVLRLVDFMPDSTKKKLTTSESARKLYHMVGDQYRQVKHLIKPQKGARVYIRKGISRMGFFQALHERNVDYVLLRWWEDLPQIPAGEDMDILIRDEHRELINDLVTFRKNKVDLKCDIYTIAGSMYGSHNDIPYFQSNLAHALIETRELYRGAYVPSPLLHFASLAYHAIFHKGNGSGLKGFEDSKPGLEHDYPEILKNKASGLDLKIEITVVGLYEWLKERKFVPAEDTLTKLVEVRPELSFLQQRLHSDVRGGDLLVFVLRERLLKDGLLQDFTSFLEEEFNFDLLDVQMLNARERDQCSREIRGGKWDKGPYKYSGGPPVAIVSAFDYHPEPLTQTEQLRQARMTNRNNLHSKYQYRERLQSLILMKGHYNGVHSADNEQDAQFYLSLLGSNYQNKISEMLEFRRTRYARNWNLVKVLSENSISKVEVIQYNERKAVKKTFRPGKERFLQRELYALRELSQELKFIPPILEEGEGYVIVPFFENILEKMNEKEKEKILSTKADEIAEVICSMYTRGLIYLGFTPESIILTSNGEFYCTGFSFLQKYLKEPSHILEVFEVAGLPKDFDGDVPRGYYYIKSPMKTIWRNMDALLEERINSCGEVLETDY